MTKSDDELEKLEQELEDTRAALAQSEKMARLGNLVAGVAHEINTPIGSIHSNSDLMMRALEKLQKIVDDAPELSENRELGRVLDALTSIGTVNQTACQRIVAIVRSLKTFVRLEQRQCTRADIHEELETTLTLVRHELKNRITVVREFGELPQIECLANQVNQVFLNLLVNASQAIEGKGEIRIATRNLGDRVEIAFSDTGSGIRPEHLDQLFEPGFTTKDVGVGSGLGLAICYKIIEAHGGRIEVESELGRGTTFTIMLPVHAPDPPD